MLRMFLSSCLLAGLVASTAAAETKPESDHKVKYSSYAEMVRTEKPGTDFKVVSRPAAKSFLIAAPHGGNIEPGSTELADAIAGDTWGFYAFNGLKRDSSGLFLPSGRFDEPEFVRIAKNYRTVIAIHVIPSADRLIYVGGNQRQLADSIAQALKAKGYDAKPPSGSTSAYSSANLINRRGAGGVQIEIASAIVDGMFRGPVAFERIREDPARRTVEFNQFVQAVRFILERATRDT